MARAADLQKQFLDHAASLFVEELVDEQFVRVLKSSPENNQDFALNLLSTFLRDSNKTLKSLSELLAHQPVNFNEVYQRGQHLRGSATTIGASKIKNICAEFKGLCANENLEALRQQIHQLYHEKSVLEGKLGTLFELENQIRAAGGVVPVLILRPRVCNGESSNRR